MMDRGHPPNMESIDRNARKTLDRQETFPRATVEAEACILGRSRVFLLNWDPGTYFEFEKISVAPGLWMAKHFSMRSRAKVLQVIPKNGQEDDTYFNYHRAQPSSVLSAAVRLQNPSSAVAGRQNFVRRKDRAIFFSFLSRVSLRN